MTGYFSQTNLKLFKKQKRESLFLFLVPFLLLFLLFHVICSWYIITQVQSRVLLDKWGAHLKSHNNRDAHAQLHEELKSDIQLRFACILIGTLETFFKPGQ